MRNRAGSRSSIFLIPIREIPGSNPSRDTDYLKLIFLWFYSVPSDQ
jgi:hypothetical protein